MKFNPITKELFTDSGQFIKRLFCPYKVYWENLLLNKENPATRFCSHCNHQIIDTAMISDTELLEVLRKDSETCLKVDLNQNNLKIILNVILEKK